MNIYEKKFLDGVEQLRFECNNTECISMIALDVVKKFEAKDTIQFL